MSPAIGAINGSRAGRRVAADGRYRQGVATPLWTDILADAIGLLGGATGIVSALLVGRSNRSAHRSAVASERSAVAAEQSAVAADKTAKAEAEVARIEAEREHERLGPPALEKIDAHSTRQDTLQGSITVPHDYRVRGEAVWGNASWALNLPLLLIAGHKYTFQIESWTRDRKEPEARMLRFRFWPPAETDEVEHWSCPCGRPLQEGGTNSPGHWERRVPINYVPPPMMTVR
jgi:hypothetical protein